MNGLHPEPSTTVTRETLAHVWKMLGETPKRYSVVISTKTKQKLDAAWLRWFKRNAKRKAQKR